MFQKVEHRHVLITREQIYVILFLQIKLANLNMKSTESETIDESGCTGGINRHSCIRVLELDKNTQYVLNLLSSPYYVDRSFFESILNAIYILSQSQHEQFTETTSVLFVDAKTPRVACNIDPPPGFEHVVPNPPSQFTDIRSSMGTYYDFIKSLGDVNMTKIDHLALKTITEMCKFLNMHLVVYKIDVDSSSHVDESRRSDTDIYIHPKISSVIIDVVPRTKGSFTSSTGMNDTIRPKLHVSLGLWNDDAHKNERFTLIVSDTLHSPRSDDTGNEKRFKKLSSSTPPYTIREYTTVHESMTMTELVTIDDARPLDDIETRRISVSYNTSIEHNREYLPRKPLSEMIKSRVSDFSQSSSESIYDRCSVQLSCPRLEQGSERTFGRHSPRYNNGWNVSSYGNRNVQSSHGLKRSYNRHTQSAFDGTRGVTFEAKKSDVPYTYMPIQQPIALPTPDYQPSSVQITTVPETRISREVYAQSVYKQIADKIVKIESSSAKYTRDIEMLSREVEKLIVTKRYFEGLYKKADGKEDILIKKPINEVEEDDITFTLIETVQVHRTKYLQCLTEKMEELDSLVEEKKCLIDKVRLMQLMCFDCLVEAKRLSNILA